jgi:hypothetical protein
MPPTCLHHSDPAVPVTSGSLISRRQRPPPHRSSPESQSGDSEGVSQVGRTFWREGQAVKLARLEPARLVQIPASR